MKEKRRHEREDAMAEGFEGGDCLAFRVLGTKVLEEEQGEGDTVRSSLAGVAKGREDGDARKGRACWIETKAEGLLRL